MLSAHPYVLSHCTVYLQPYQTVKGQLPPSCPCCCSKNRSKNWLSIPMIQAIMHWLLHNLYPDPTTGYYSLIWMPLELTWKCSFFVFPPIFSWLARKFLTNKHKIFLVAKLKLLRNFAKIFCTKASWDTTWKVSCSKARLNILKQ